MEDMFASAIELSWSLAAASISLLIACGIAWRTFALVKSKRNRSTDHFTAGAWNYHALEAVVQQHQISLPAMFVLVDAYDRNADRLASIAHAHGKTLRMATKVCACA